MVSVLIFFFMWGCCLIFFFFFFSSRRRHTRFDCDWSSDVCSSDLGQRGPGHRDFRDTHGVVLRPEGTTVLRDRLPAARSRGMGSVLSRQRFRLVSQIGRASCRERSVDIGGRGIMKEKNNYVGLEQG